MSMVVERVIKPPGPAEARTRLAQEVVTFRGRPDLLPENGFGWTTVLLVDHNEHNSGGDARREGRLNRLIVEFNRHFEARDIPHCERTGSLPAGDYLWVARKPGYQDRVLVCVVERKTYKDLGRSLVPQSNSKKTLTRMYMQKKKLRNSGIRNKIILVEGGPTGDEQRDKAAATFCEELEAGVHEGISLVRTYDTDDTIRFLVRQHMELSRELPVAYLRTLQDVKTSVTTAMSEPRFKFFLGLLEVKKVGQAKADALSRAFETMTALKEAFQSDSDGTTRQIAVTKTSGGKSIGAAAANELRQWYERGQRETSRNKRKRDAAETVIPSDSWPAPGMPSSNASAERSNEREWTCWWCKTRNRELHLCCSGCYQEKKAGGDYRH